jgi:transposase-like protein
MTVAKRNKRAKPDPELVKLADSLLANYQKPEDLVGENGLLKQLTKMLVERALETEMSEHLGHGKSETVTNATGNTRNGHSAKTLQGEFGELPLDIPRDRQGAFEPKLVERHQTRWSGFDDKIISLYARGLSVREIQGHLEEMYGTEVSPTLISAVTDAVSEEVKLWQARPLDALYPIVYLDCIHVKVRDSGAVRTKAVYLAIGVNMDGHKEVLGLYEAPRVCRRPASLALRRACGQRLFPIVSFLCFSRRHIAEWAEQPAMVIPMDPFECRQLNGLQVRP